MGKNARDKLREEKMKNQQAMDTGFKKSQG